MGVWWSYPGQGYLHASSAGHIARQAGYARTMTKIGYALSCEQFGPKELIDQAKRAQGNTGELMLQYLERRLDNCIRRIGVARTIWAARQMVAHGHVLVNGKKVDRPSYRVSIGDTITLKPKIHKLAQESMETMGGQEIGAWIDFNPSELTAKIVSLPTADQIPFDVNTNLIIEYYG